MVDCETKTVISVENTTVSTAKESTASTKQWEGHVDRFMLIPGHNHANYAPHGQISTNNIVQLLPTPLKCCSIQETIAWDQENPSW